MVSFRAMNGYEVPCCLKQNLFSAAYVQLFAAVQLAIPRVIGELLGSQEHCHMLCSVLQKVTVFENTVCRLTIFVLDVKNKPS